MPTGRSLTVDQVAKRLGVHRDTIRRSIRRGELRATRDRLHAGGPFLVTEEDLATFVTAKQPPAVAVSAD